MVDRFDIIEARRALRPERGEGNYRTLADVGLDGCWVSPIQMTSDSPCGPVLVANNFLGWRTARERRAEILRYGGYLPDLDFNRVLDLALWQAGMHRRDIYITQVVHLLPENTNDDPRDPDLEERSFREVTQHELKGRHVIALGEPARKRCCNWLKEHPRDFCLVNDLRHPSARGARWQQRANELAEALCQATERGCGKRKYQPEEVGVVWQREGKPRLWPIRDKTK